MRRNKTLSEEYFSWLCKSVKPKRGSYIYLFKELHAKKFRWFIRNDDNRCEDGIALRDLYIQENDLDETHTEVKYFLKADCTVLEVLVALAKHIDFLMYDLENPVDNSSKWFMEMIMNLGLGGFKDPWKFAPISEAQIDDILENLMDRTYDYYGNGGLFPLKKRPPKDQAKTEIWDQLQLYLDEKYG